AESKGPAPKAPEQKNEPRRVTLKPPVEVPRPAKPMTPRPQEAARGAELEKEPVKPAIPREPVAPAAKEGGKEAAPPQSEEPRIPKPVSAPTTDLDLGLPTLHLDTVQPGVWGRLPIVAKIAVAAAIIAGLSGLSYFLLTGSASAVPKAAAREGI